MSIEHFGCTGSHNAWVEILVWSMFIANPRMNMHKWPLVRCPCACRLHKLAQLTGKSLPCAHFCSRHNTLYVYRRGPKKNVAKKRNPLDPFLTLWCVGVPWLQRGEYVDIARLAQRSALCVGQIALRCFSEILVKKILWVLKFSRSFLDGLVTW